MDEQKYIDNCPHFCLENEWNMSSGEGNLKLIHLNKFMLKKLDIRSTDNIFNTDPYRVDQGFGVFKRFVVKDWVSFYSKLFYIYSREMSLNGSNF